MADTPSFRLHTIEQRRNKLVKTVLRPMVGSAVDAAEMAAGLVAKLPKNVSYDAVFESVRYLAGVELTNEEAVRVAWRLAGNLPHLVNGVAVPPWQLQRVDEWVPLQVLRVEYARGRRGRTGYNVTARVMAGTSCPLKITVFWYPAVASYVATQVGFTPPWGKYPYSSAQDFVGLRFLGLIEATRSKVLPEFHEISCSTSMIARNRADVLKLRLRVDGTLCPFGYVHACRDCGVGQQDCAAATHYHNYEIKTCLGCEREDMPHDPSDRLPHCISCNLRDRLKSQV